MAKGDATRGRLKTSLIFSALKAGCCFTPVLVIILRALKLDAAATLA